VLVMRAADARSCPHLLEVLKDMNEKVTILRGEEYPQGGEYVTFVAVPTMSRGIQARYVSAERARELKAAVPTWPCTMVIAIVAAPKFARMDPPIRKVIKGHLRTQLLGSFDAIAEAKRRAEEEKRDTEAQEKAA